MTTLSISQTTGKATQLTRNSEGLRRRFSRVTGFLVTAFQHNQRIETPDFGFMADALQHDYSYWLDALHAPDHPTGYRR